MESTKSRNIAQLGSDLTWTLNRPPNLKSFQTEHFWLESCCFDFWNFRGLLHFWGSLHFEVFFILDELDELDVLDVLDELDEQDELDVLDILDELEVLDKLDRQIE